MKTNGGNARRGRWLLASALAWSLAGWVATAESARGAGIRSHPLPTADPGRPFVLDQQGRRIALAGGGRGLPTRLPAGVAPTYLAYRIGDRSQAPEGAPVISVTPGRGRPGLGPLHLDALAKASLDAELARTGQVALVTPRQSFLVESWGGSILSDVAGSSKTWRADVEAPTNGPGPRGEDGRDDSVEGTIKDWYKTSSNAIKNWNQQALDAVKGMFSVDPPKPVIIPPKAAAAQMLAAPDAAEQVLPAPVPEPGGLIVFAVATAAAAWRFRSGRR